MSLRCLSLGDRGLDLVLSGGLRWVERLPGRASATLVVRGPAGAGKTLCALQVATALARALETDVAYACVELLPSELLAQARGLFAEGEGPALDARSPLAGDDRRPGLIAQLLELPQRANSLSEALESFWQRPVWDERLGKGRRPRVLVLDSLIGGYGLGSDLPREIADAVCKLAVEWGVALVLVEEAAPETPSPWVFAADTVLELSSPRSDVAPTTPAPTERRAAVVKHRFGPSDAGPHRFELVRGRGFVLSPRPSAWLEPWAVDEVRASVMPPGSDAPVVLATPADADGGRVLSPLPGHVVLVHGPDLPRVVSLARSIRREPLEPAWRTLEGTFHQPLGVLRDDGAVTSLGLQHPYLSSHRMLRALLDVMGADAARPIGLVRLGDLAAVRTMADPAGILRAVGTLCTLARACGFAVVLYESTAARMNFVGLSREPMYFPDPGVLPPAASTLADAVLEVFREALGDGKVPDLQVRLRP